MNDMFHTDPPLRSKRPPNHCPNSTADACQQHTPMPLTTNQCSRAIIIHYPPLSPSIPTRVLSAHATASFSTQALKLSNRISSLFPAPPFLRTSTHPRNNDANTPSPLTAAAR